jgi:hypothetical protein
MKLAEFETLTEIIKELYDYDVDGLTGFFHDCKQLRARKTAKYVKECIDADRPTDRPFEQRIAHMLLSEDFSGC